MGHGLRHLHPFFQRIERHREGVFVSLEPHRVGVWMTSLDRKLVVGVSYPSVCFKKKVKGINKAMEKEITR